jgi:hypothetical protein
MIVVKFSISTAGIVLCVTLKRCFSIQPHKDTCIHIHDKEILRDEINLIFWENTASRFKAMCHKLKIKSVWDHTPENNVFKLNAPGSNSHANFRILLFIKTHRASGVLLHLGHYNRFFANIRHCKVDFVHVESGSPYPIDEIAYLEAENVVPGCISTQTLDGDQLETHGQQSSCYVLHEDSMLP